MSAEVSESRSNEILLLHYDRAKVQTGKGRGTHRERGEGKKDGGNRAVVRHFFFFFCNNDDDVRTGQAGDALESERHDAGYAQGAQSATEARKGPR